MTSVKMLVIGDINIDAVITAREYPPEGGEAVVERTNFRLGGSGCNTAVTLSKLGAETWLAGNLGTDLLGIMAMNYIREAGLQESLILQKESHQTGFFCIVVSGHGERTMFGGRGCNAIPPDYQQAAGVLAEVDGLHISGYTLKNDEQYEVVARLIREAKRQGKVISLDPGVCTASHSKERINGILPMIDYLLISQLELSDYSHPDEQQTVIHRLMDSGIKAIVLKMGSDGSKLIDHEGEIFHPAFKHERHAIQDTTGAGDAFNAGFLFARLNSLPVFDCLALGNLCAFRSITSPHGIVDVCLDENYLNSLKDLLVDCSMSAQQEYSLLVFLQAKIANQSNEIFHNRRTF